MELAHESEIISNSNNTTDDILPELDIPKNDMDYSLQFKKSSKSMNWKECYEAGKRGGYFSVYTSSASLKRAYFEKMLENNKSEFNRI